MARPHLPVHTLRNLLGPLGLVAALSACAGLPQETSQSAPSADSTTSEKDTTPRLSQRAAARSFLEVARRMEPQIERECVARSGGSINCDYLLVVDDSETSSPNAFQTRDESGRPVIGFNLPLIAEARNADELAFVMAHEGAHHILGHIDKTSRSAMAGALVFGALVRAAGGPSVAVEGAQKIGATVGGRAYSKDYELQADQLGTVIAYNAGFDPERGAQFFGRIPDPGDQFLGTHPANARRKQIVAETMAALRAGQKL